MGQAGELEIGGRRVLFLVKAAKISRRSRTVKAVIVVENSHQHEFMSVNVENYPACNK